MNTFLTHFVLFFVLYVLIVCSKISILRWPCFNHCCCEFMYSFN